MTLNSYPDTPWLVPIQRNPHAKLRLLCFHYAGGSASAFRTWVNHVLPELDIVAVQFPGREGRYGEGFLEQFNDLISQLVNALQPVLNMPYVVLGHSLGALTGYEFIRALKQQQLRQPWLFIPAGRGAPQYPCEDETIAFLPEDEFVAKLLEEYGDKVRPVLQTKELRKVFVPQIRADYLLSETYKYQPGIKLDCPVVAMAGTQEYRISDTALSGWSELTNGRFSHYRVTGDHFFIHSAEHEMLERVKSVLKPIIQNMNPLFASA